jgi:hypothetical protein
LPNVAVRLFQLFAEGSLKIEFEKEIEKEMREKLTWKASKNAIETEFNQGKYANDEDRKKKKIASMSDPKIKARLIK